MINKKNMAQEFDREFAEVLVKAVVENVDDVKIERIIDDRGVLLTAHVNPSDLGYVIGKKGATAKAIRTLLKAIGAKENSRVNLKIYQPDRPEFNAGSQE